jgi:glycosyltransferase involved in cell wall biosynthesis
MLELVWLAGSLRRKGFRAFFVRTSQTAALPLILTTRLLGGRVMYWNCGRAPKNKLRELGIRQSLRHEIPMRLAFRWADIVVTGTPSLAEHYSRTYGISRDRIAVLPNEIDLQSFRVPTADERREAREAIDVAEDEPLVLAVHRFSPIRRTLMYIPSVLDAVVQRHPHVRFLLAGGGPEEAEVRLALEEARLTRCVQMVGAVPHARIWQLYAAADVFMMPSYTEGFPRVLLEAMAAGLPIASTDVGGVREVLPSSYHTRLAHRDRPLELARAIDELLSDPKTARGLSDEGLRWVTRFDADVVARRLAELAIS